MQAFTLDPVAELIAYHARSKHQVNRYAPGPGRLDWANQPDPFRVFEGAPRIDLALSADSLDTLYDDVRRGSLPPARRFDAESIGILFELSFALSAWKAHGGNRWALRCNPSSGNLHPTEAYLACPQLPGIGAGVHHYLSRDHVFEQRARIDDRRWTDAFAGRGILVGLSSIHWREAWKYGMRAWRYCQHDCGHALAAVSYAAAALGWPSRVLVSAADATIAVLLGLDRAADFRDAEAEAPEALLWIGEADEEPDVAQWVQCAQQADWQGHANRLSADHVDWPDIDAIHRATHKAATPATTAVRQSSTKPPAAPAQPMRFATIARQRRSAVAFDGKTSLDAAAFYAMLEAIMIRPDAPPWCAWTEAARVHAAIFVHRVNGLEAGLYMLVRDPAVLDDLKQAMRDDWLWRKVGPHHLPLYLLLPHDLRDPAKWICCHQEIGADSCFALGMLAHFEAARQTPWRYRHLFWECGIIGQALYLEAEAAGVRATGIGCFFDDEMHGLLGLRDDAWQSLYHFTTGGAVDDTRLSTLPPYAFQP
jgi:SagB-type dehydrogenase family enzyme